MSFTIYRKNTTQLFQLILGNWQEVTGVDTVPLFTDTAPNNIIDLIPEDLTAEYGRKAIITVEVSEIAIAFDRDVTNTDRLFIPPDGNIEIDVGTNRVSATVLNPTSVNGTPTAAAVQVWVAKYLKKIN